MVMDEVEAFAEKLRTGSYSEKTEAVEKLGELKDARAAGPLVKALGDAHSAVREKAAGALADMGKPAVEPLIGALGCEYWDVRYWAAWALGEIGDVEAVGPLIGALGDGDRFVREKAAEGLVKMGEPAAGKLVEAANEPEKRHLRWEISGILRKIDEEAKRKPHDFGIRNVTVIAKPEVPKEFKKLALKDAQKGRVTG